MKGPAWLPFWTFEAYVLKNREIQGKDEANGHLRWPISAKKCFRMGAAFGARSVTFGRRSLMMLGNHLPDWADLIKGANGARWPHIYGIHGFPLGDVSFWHISTNTGYFLR